MGEGNGFAVPSIAVLLMVICDRTIALFDNLGCKGDRFFLKTRILRALSDRKSLLISMAKAHFRKFPDFQEAGSANVLNSLEVL